MKHYLFDFDGTLCDTKRGILNGIEYMFNELDVKIKLTPEEMEPLFIGPPLNEALSPYFPGDESGLHLAIKTFRDYYNKTGVLENELYPGIKNMLCTLKERNVSLYIVSSKPDCFIKIILEMHGISDLFKGIYSPGLKEGSLTKFDLITSALTEIKEKDSDPLVLMIGDRKYDIDGAHEAGISGVGVLWGAAADGELQKHKAEYIVASTTEFLDLDLNLQEQQ